MTTQQSGDDQRANTADAPIADYLRQHPDFFVRHASLLASLLLPHARGGGAVSLVERQVEVLREKSQSLETRLAELVAVARTNEQLVAKFHQLTRRLLAARDRQDLISRLELSLREDFDVPQARLVLVGSASAGLLPGRFAIAAEAKDLSLAGFDSLLASGKPRCGALRDSQREFLFGGDGAGLNSVALVPVGGANPSALLALGSPDKDRFNPGISTDFLARLAELVGDALSRG